MNTKARRTRKARKKNTEDTKKKQERHGEMKKLTNTSSLNLINRKL